MTIWTDVNLSEIQFPGSSSEVLLRFLNMSDGAAVGALVCVGVIAFTYRDALECALPAYIGKVDHTLITAPNAGGLLERLGIRVDMGRLPVEIHHVRVEGGLDIEIVCRAVTQIP
jgi:hypothetical protein